MTRSLLLASVLLFVATWAGAQKEDTGQLPPRGEGKSQTLEGCLQGSNDNFTLTDRAGTVYRLLGHSGKLSDHVGHEVEVTGLVNTVTSSTSASTGAGAGSQTVQVQHINHVGKTCASHSQ